MWSANAKYANARRRSGLGGRDPSDQVFLFVPAFSADGECVQNTQTEGVLQSFVDAAAQIAFSQNLHAHNSFSRSAHLPENPDHRGRIGVHV